MFLLGLVRPPCYCHEEVSDEFLRSETHTGFVLKSLTAAKRCNSDDITNDVPISIFK